MATEPFVSDICILITCQHFSSEHRFWTDDNIRQLIQKQYPWFLDTFDEYPYPIQRVDAGRYFILYHYGGVYLVSLLQRCSVTLL